MIKRSFASDNNAGVHPEVIEAVKAANDGHVVAYGDDPVTAGGRSCFRNILAGTLRSISSLAARARMFSV